MIASLAQNFSTTLEELDVCFVESVHAATMLALSRMLGLRRLAISTSYSDMFGGAGRGSAADWRCAADSLATLPNLEHLTIWWNLKKLAGDGAEERFQRAMPWLNP